MHNRYYAALIATAAILTFGTSMASAASGVVKSNVNVRAGAGTHERVIARLTPGTSVNIGTCRRGWCEVTIKGRKGFILETLLRRAAEPTRHQQPEPRRRDDRQDRQPQDLRPSPGTRPS